MVAHALQATVQNSTTTTTTAAHAASLVLVALEVVVAMAAIAVLGTLFLRLTRRIAVRAGVSKPVARTADQWGVLMIVAVAVAVFASLTGLSSEFTTLTISGIAGLAVSLALQTTLSNIIAGILMFQDGVLRIGDDLEYGSVRGEVVKLALRSTWLKRPDGSIAVIGNSNLAAGPIVNHSATSRLERKLGV
jgi:small-conductance mechanosensitive channel